MAFSKWKLNDSIELANIDGYLEQDNNNISPNPPTGHPYHYTTSYPNPRYSLAFISPPQPDNAARGGHSAPGTAPANTSQQSSGGVLTTIPSTNPQTGPHGRPWDGAAEVMALAAVYDGKSVAQIRNQLLLHGYEAEILLIDTKLCSLGVSNMVHKPGAGLTWNPDADTLALNAHRSGQTVTQIAAQLCRNGYVAPVALVKASLERQGVRI
ncbi:hypothetical protein MMC31_002141 [Peltigera leucophlebia]|nr:hypothetical protein [Peltigera leucophlebia]